MTDRGAPPACVECENAERQRKYYTRALRRELEKAERQGILIGCAIAIGICALVAAVLVATKTAWPW